MNSVQQTRQIPRRPLYKRLFISRDWLPPGISSREIWFILLHIPLGVAMSMSGAAGKAHVLLVTLLGIKWALMGRDVRKVMYAVAYVVGAEVFWRMTRANFLHEYGKYLVSFLLLLWLVRHPPKRWPAIAVLYFALLLPGCLFTAVSESWYHARRNISFNISGPFSLLLSAIFFYQIRMPRQELIRVLVAALGPLVGIASITAFKIYSIDEVQFTSDSNTTTSGGFGPNQVSAVLGFGVWLAFVLFFAFRNELKKRIFLGGVLLWLLAQCALTFSRTGGYLAVGSLALTSLYFLRIPKIRPVLLGGGVVLFLVGALVVLPKLDAFTDGALTDRFAETQASGREDILHEDLAIFADHAVIGTGIGRAKNLRPNRAAAHIEYTRLLAEHGLLGVGANFLLLGMGLFSFLKARDNVARAISFGALGFAYAFMLVSAMRMVLPGFLIGLTFATWLAVAATGRTPSSGTRGRRLPSNTPSRSVQRQLTAQS